MKPTTIMNTLNVLMLLVFFSLGGIVGYIYCQTNHTQQENPTMIIRTTYQLIFGCEICVKSSWTVLEVQVGTTIPLTKVRMCYSCWKAKGGSDEGWNDIIDSQLQKEKSNV